MFLSSEIGTSGRAPGDDFWFLPIGGTSAAGVRVSPTTALSVSTLYACCLVLAQTLAMVPIHLYQRLEPRGKRRAIEHPLHRLIHMRPNRWQTSYQWRQMMQWHLALRYNAYSRIHYDATGAIDELVPMHPDRIVVERFVAPNGNDTFRYHYRPLNGREFVLTPGEVFHVRGMVSDGIEGFSPLEAQKDSIGEAIAAQRFNARRMDNDARPGGVLEWAGSFNDDEERRKFRASFQAAQSGINRGKIAVLERGMTWNEIAVKNTDLQFIEIRELKASDIAAIYRMPPHKVGLLQHATFSNIEHQGIEFKTDTMLPWFVNWEQELSIQLLTQDEQRDFFFEFLAEGLLRGDSKARGEFYGKRFMTGSLSPNDIRELENENPVGGGDRYFVPVNMMPLDRADDMVVSRTAESVPEDQDSRDREADERAGEAAGLVRKEIAQMRRKGRKDAASFYAAHTAQVGEKLGLDETAARGYCASRLAGIQAAANLDTWLADLEENGMHQLLALTRKDET